VICKWKWAFVCNEDGSFRFNGSLKTLGESELGSEKNFTGIMSISVSIWLPLIHAMSCCSSSLYSSICIHTNLPRWLSMKCRLVTLP
jgi:hypothetical protein